MEFYEPIRVGETIHIKMKPYDRWIKRGKYYLTYQVDCFNQLGTKKATCWSTLILPKTKADIMKFARGERGLEV